MPAKSKSQQRFFGMVRAAQKGELENPSSEVADVADDISVKDAKKFAKTKHKGLPEKKTVDEEASYKEFVGRAQAASERIKKAKQAKKDANAKAAYKDRVTKGVRFYDKKGSGYMKQGKKVYN